MTSDSDRSRLEGEEAHRFRVRSLRVLVDRRHSAWAALLICPETGELWEETVEGRWSELLVLTQVTREYAEGKYGPLPQ